MGKKKGVGYSRAPKVFGQYCKLLLVGKQLYVFTEREPCDHCREWLNDFAAGADTTLVIYHVAGLGPNTKQDDQQMKLYFKELGLVA